MPVGLAQAPASLYMRAVCRFLQRTLLTCGCQLLRHPGSCAAPLSFRSSCPMLMPPSAAMSGSMCCEFSDTNCWSASLTTAAALVAQLDTAGVASAAGPAQARAVTLRDFSVSQQPLQRARGGSCVEGSCLLADQKPAVPNPAGSGGTGM